MGFLGWIAGIIISYLPLLVLRLGKTTPAPEVATGKITTRGGIVANKTEDILIITITTFCSRRRREGETVTRIAELFHRQRLTDATANSKMFINILLGVLAGYAQIFQQMVFSCPTPVVRPQMDIAIIHITVGTNALPAIQLAFTAPLAFTSDGDKMVLIE